MPNVNVHQLTAAYWQNDTDQYDRMKAGQNCTRYLRFDRHVNVAGFELQSYQRKWGTSASHLRVLPKHLRVSATDEQGMEWNILYEDNDLPPQDKLHVVFEEPVSLRYVKVELLEHHGPSGSHIELASNPKNLLFQALDGFHCTFADGKEQKDAGISEKPFVTVQPFLSGNVDIDPAALPPNVTSEQKNREVIFTNRFCKMGFSTLRPMNTAWGWDSEGTDRQQDSFLYKGHTSMSHFAQGPFLSHVTADTHAGLLGGDVEVKDNVVKYLHVSPRQGITRNYCFTIEENAVLLEIEQKVTEPIKAIECEAWRWIWDTKKSIIAPLASPFTHGKNGRCMFPMICHSPNFGDISIELVEGDPSTSFLKCDTWRAQALSFLGIECGVTIAEDGELLLKQGTSRMSVKIRSAELALNATESARMHPSFRRAWGSVFGFRPEYFGMSNNASSLNCHFVQHVYADMAFHTSTSVGVDIIELVAFSANMGLCGGMGYGDNREYFMDSDASLLIAAGVYVCKTKNKEWAKNYWTPMLEAGQRLLNKRWENGLVACDKLSGNSGEHHWGSNWWDIISFGHLDAFSNAFIYRAFRQVQSIAALLGEQETENIYKYAADRMQSEFFNCFYNDETGWLAGWRSRDGKLHDYAFLFVNGIAIMYGLVPEQHIRPILEKLEAKRIEIGYDFFDLGLPGNLIPIRSEDYALNVSGSSKLEDGSDGYQNYENGGATMSQAYFYVRALGMAGMPIAETIGNAILDAFEHGDIIGGLGGGNDWRLWDGRYTGYEGLLSDQMYVLLGVAQNKGLVSDVPIMW